MLVHAFQLMPRDATLEDFGAKKKPEGITVPAGVPVPAGATPEEIQAKVDEAKNQDFPDE
jgi:hypothetical protein